MLSLPFLTFYCTGMILGAGIYSVIGKAAAPAQESLWLSFIVAAIVALLTALSYAELSTMYPQTGAEYVFLGKAFPHLPWIAYTCGAMMIFAGTSTAATVALAFASYLEHFAPIPILVSSFFVLLIFTGFNIWGIQQSSRLNALMTLIEISGLVLFIGIAIAYSENLTAVVSNSRLETGTLSGAALVFFAYLGFESMVNLSEESRNPSKDIPKAILISLFLSTTLYVLVSLAALALMPLSELSRTDAVMSTAVNRYNPTLAAALAGIALFSTANTVLISMISTSRILFSMARQSDLPPIFAKISKRNQTPWVSALAVLTMATTLLPLKAIEVVASISSLATLLAFVAVNVALIKLRLDLPQLPRPFKVPLAIKGWPILPTLGTFTCVIFLTQFSTPVYVVGSIVLILTAIIYQLHKRYFKP